MKQRKAKGHSSIEVSHSPRIPQKSVAFGIDRKSGVNTAQP